MSDSDRMSWYRKQQLVPAGSKRAFDDIVVTQGSTEAEGTYEIDADHYVPWWLFYDRLYKTMAYEKIVEKWDAAISAGGTEAKWRCEFKWKLNSTTASRGVSPLCPPRQGGRAQHREEGWGDGQV